MERSARHRAILQNLGSHPKVYVTYLAQHLGVSQATIRKDLAVLEESGLLRRVHGGAVALSVNLRHQEIDFTTRLAQQTAEKQAIAQHALQFVQDHDSILLDASTTCYELASELSATTFQLTVVTNGLKSASILAKNKLIRVFAVGGALRNDNAITGLLGAGLFSKIHVHKAFVSARGIDAVHGLTDFSLEEVELKTFMVEQASVIYALVDHTKIGAVSVASFCPLSRVSCVITDNGASTEAMAGLTKEGVLVERPEITPFPSA